MGITTMLKATKKQDEWMTPDYAVKALLPFLPEKSEILCPFDKPDSAFVRVLRGARYKVWQSHIEGPTHGKDFFSFDGRMQSVKNYDFIISNPPYSQKDAVFKKLFELDRPFCMLMGATAGLFEGKRFNLFQEHGDNLTVIWLSPRVSYIDQSGVVMKSPPFQSCYVCWRLYEGRQDARHGHLFVSVEK